MAIEPGLKQVRHVVAVGSGKGGVGKSTVAVNLAIALRHGGAKVGLLDADIYGPSQPRMLGAKTAELETTPEGTIVPTVCFGVSFVSMGLLMGDHGPVVWRAPMAMKVIHQFLGKVSWGALDYLIIDLPPGTGDVQLTLAQQASLSGAVIVSTPQDVAIDVARKGLEMFRQVKVPILGVIENMSGFACPSCGHETDVFGSGGGKLLAEKTGVPFLGGIPLSPEILLGGESGVPVLIGSPDSAVARAYVELAREVEAQITQGQAATAAESPRSIEIGPDGALAIEWGDGHRGRHRAYHLRVSCPCAHCVDENSGRQVLDRSKVPLDISIRNVGRVGRYALGIHFSDGHNTGLYAFERLRALCECEACVKARKSDRGAFQV